jgi:calcium-dependent protein kinase
LKLENFLFEDHNSNSPLILIDFGLSKHFSPNERLTQKVGSCYYTAPEVLNGNYDHRCDVWSLGVLCYMLLSGSPPFFGKSVEDVYHSILNKEANFNDKKFKHISNSCMDFMKVSPSLGRLPALLTSLSPSSSSSSSPAALAGPRGSLQTHLGGGAEASLHLWRVLFPEVR